MLLNGLNKQWDPYDHKPTTSCGMHTRFGEAALEMKSNLVTALEQQYRRCKIRRVQVMASAGYSGKNVES